MLLTLLNNYEEAAAIVLFGIGFTMLLLHRNLIKIYGIRFCGMD